MDTFFESLKASMLHFTVHCGNESNTNLKQFSLTNYQTGVLTDFPPLLPFTKLAGFIPLKSANQRCLAEAAKKK